MGQLLKDLTPRYTVNVDGKDVSVNSQMPFRMNGGDKQITPEQAIDKMTDKVKTSGQWPADPAQQQAMKTMIARNAYGRPTAQMIKDMTDTLTKGGALQPYLDQLKQDRHGSPLDPKGLQTAIRRMQWDYGIGADCNGFCQMAYQATNGKPPTASWADALITVDKTTKESLNPNFKKVGLDQAKVGDVMKLDPIEGKTGHNVIVTDTRTLDGAALSKVSATPAPSGPLKAFSVISSFGANGDPDSLRGGTRRETWVYDQAANKWGTLTGNKVSWSAVDGPYGHKFVGIYHGQ
jgi:hypothetical protein